MCLAQQWNTHKSTSKSVGLNLWVATPLRGQTTPSQGSPKTIGNTDIYTVTQSSSKNTVMK